MGIELFIIIWVAIVIISILIIRHNKKAREEERERQRQERERQRREWRELEEKVRQQDREVKKTIRQTQKAMIKAMADDGLAKITARGKAWHKAMDQAQAEFKEKGIEDLSYQNTDLKKRADEIYASGVYAEFEEDNYKKEIQKGEKIRQTTNNTSKRTKKFNPRITTTYQYADYGKQLVIDGIPIYKYERDETDKFVKKPVDEGNFASSVEYRIRNAPYWQAVKGYQVYLNDYIQWDADRCNENKTENIFGGYLFTDAMVELCAGCTEGQKEKIGKIMTDYRNGGMRTSRLKQLLWDENTGVDNYFFTDIARATDFQEEQELMADYYHECEFETEEEVYEYFNNSQYLKKYPRLREEAIKDALKWKIGKDSE